MANGGLVVLALIAFTVFVLFDFYKKKRASQLKKKADKDEQGDFDIVYVGLPLIGIFVSFFTMGLVEPGMPRFLVLVVTLGAFWIASRWIAGHK